MADPRHFGINKYLELNGDLTKTQELCHEAKRLLFDGEGFLSAVMVAIGCSDSVSDEESLLFEMNRMNLNEQVFVSKLKKVSAWLNKIELKGSSEESMSLFYSVNEGRELAQRVLKGNIWNRRELLRLAILSGICYEKLRCLIYVEAWENYEKN